MKRVLFTVVGAAFLLSGAVVYAQDAAKVAAGKKAYETQVCKTCHVLGGVGTKGVASVLDGVGSKLKPEEMKKWFTDTAAMEAKLPKKPLVKMSDYLKTHKISDADVDALVAYLQTLK